MPDEIEQGVSDAALSVSEIYLVAFCYQGLLKKFEGVVFQLFVVQEPGHFKQTERMSCSADVETG